MRKFLSTVHLIDLLQGLWVTFRVYAIGNICTHLPIGVGRLPKGLNRPLHGAYECR